LINNGWKKSVVVVIGFLVLSSGLVTAMNSFGMEINYFIEELDTEDTNSFYQRSKSGAYEVWNVTFGGAYDDLCLSVLETDDECYILTGFFEPEDNMYDGQLIKVDHQGSLIWDKIIGTPEADILTAIQPTNDNGYIIVGGTNYSNPPNPDIWLVKIDEHGNETWNHTYGGSLNDIGLSVLVTQEHDYLIYGVTYSYGAGSADVWMIKTDENGTELWNYTYGTSEYETVKPNTLHQCSDNGFIFTCGILVDNLSYNNDVWVLKTDHNGTEEWNQTYGGPYSDIGHTVQETPDGGYIICGYTDTNSTFDYDAWLIKTNATGVEEWNQTYGGNKSDNAHTLNQLPTGGYLLTGYTNSYSVGNSDVWVIKTDDNGNELWNVSFGGNDTDYSYSSIITSDGDYIIGGITESFGAGQRDMWLLRISEKNRPPYEPSNPSPAHNTINITSPILQWDGGDPDGDNVTYDVHFGTNITPPLVSTNQTNHTYDAGALHYTTTYYWQIISRDTLGAKTTGPLWQFTTATPHINLSFIQPQSNSFYLRNIRLFSLPNTTIIYGPHTFIVNASSIAGIETVEFYINGIKEHTDWTPLYTCMWEPLKCFGYTIKAVAYDTTGYNESIELSVFKWRVHPLLVMGGGFIIMRKLLFP
jgi:hypothetical protein